jgi:hypothetical protein
LTRAVLVVLSLVLGGTATAQDLGREAYNPGQLGPMDIRTSIRFGLPVAPTTLGDLDSSEKSPYFAD